MHKSRILPVALAATFVLGAGAVHAQDEAPPADGIDGTWVVDATLGNPDEDTDAFVGFRVAEVLDPGGDFVAVGRTPGVTGQLTASGSVIEDFAIEVDLTGLATDNDFRNGAIQRALGTDQYPTASFVASEPVDLGEVPAEGEPFDVSVPGVLTIREVSQDVVVEMQGGRGGESVVVVGSWPITFTDFDVSMPSAPIVVSVEDSGELEWRLYFTREAGMTEDMTDEDMSDEDMTEDAAEE